MLSDRLILYLKNVHTLQYHRINQAQFLGYSLKVQHFI